MRQTSAFETDAGRETRRRLLGWTALAFGPLFMFAVVACSRSLSVNDWVIRADHVCKAAQAKADKNPGPQSPLPGDKLRLSATRSREELDELKKIDPPEERKTAIADYLITLDHRNDTLEHYADDLDKAPAQGPLPSRARLEDFTGQAYTQAVALGLESCAGGVDFTADTTTTIASLVPGATGPGPTGIVGQPDGQDTTQDETG